MTTDEQKTSYLEVQTNSTYLRDVILRHNLRSDSSIGELLDVLASGVSSLTSPSKLAATFNSKENIHLSRQTVSNYIQYFIESFLISKAIRYDVKGRKYIDTPFKVYFEDIGVRNARIGFRQYEPNPVMENVIYNELRYRGFHVDVGVVSGRECIDGKMENNTYEVDFVANKGSQRYYIQSVFALPDEEKWIQETRGFREIEDSFKKILIVRNPVVSRYSDRGYLIMDLLNFLLDEDSLSK
jgi:predicted AAA+ superfamily ATPase